MRRRARRLLLAVAACALAHTTATSAAGPAADLLDPGRLTLRLPDVGPGYTDSAPCDRLKLAEPYSPRPLRRLAAQVTHDGCQIGFDQAWLETDRSRPTHIESTAFAFASEAGPETVIRVGRVVIARTAGAELDEVAELHATETIGDETHVFQVDSYEGPGVAVIWRSGPVLALVHAVGRREAVTQASVLQLAAAQQARVAAPTPVMPTDLDDLEVPLDDPGLRLPVRWLGRAMPAHGGRFPLTLYLADSQGLGRSRSKPGVMLQYGHEGLLRRDHRRVRVEIIDVDLELWAPRARRRLLHEELNRPCVRRYDGDLEGVDARIFASNRSASRSCGSKPPEVWRALVFSRDVAVTIDPNICTLCRRRDATYASLAGLRELLRELRPRIRETPPPG